MPAQVRGSCPFEKRVNRMRAAVGGVWPRGGQTPAPAVRTPPPALLCRFRPSLSPYPRAPAPRSRILHLCGPHIIPRRISGAWAAFQGTRPTAFAKQEEQVSPG